MFRQLMRVLVAAVVLFPLGASAQSVIPPHVNLHNGYIEVVNQIKIYDERRDGTRILRHGDVAKFDLRLYLNNNHLVQEAAINTGDTVYLNTCCILAGSLYQITAKFRGTIDAEIRPQLCNVRAIPFGYGVVVLTGVLIYEEKTAIWHRDYAAHIPTVSCPVAAP
ncbi:MAG: hypothetical protein KGN02_01700 [bacterium]|nr:hypothetical protein [bacterium]